MSLPFYLRKFFGRSASDDPLSTYKAAEVGQRAAVGQRAIVGSSGSMSPALNGGETYTIAAVDFDLLVVGELVVVWWEGERINILHRLLSKHVAGNGETYWKTKGDANAVSDPHTMTRSNYVGVAEFGVGK